MEVGIGIDAGFGFGVAEQQVLSREAAVLGYTSIWTTGSAVIDSCQLCLMRWAASAEVAPGGLQTGIAVSQVLNDSPYGFAVRAGSMSQITGGRFIFGIGSTGFLRPSLRANMAVEEPSILAAMRDYVTTIRRLLAGEQVDIQSGAFTFKSGRLAADPPPRTPVYLAALGPRMLRLAGEVADGVCINWCSPDLINWCRERINEGAERAGRDASTIKMHQFIRICVDDEDPLAARRALAHAVMGYAIGLTPEDERPAVNRRHFEMMGFAHDLDALLAMRARGAGQTELLDAFPDNLLNAVGYYGPASGANAAFSRLSKGLDHACLRIFMVDGMDAARASMAACAPSAVKS